VALVAARLRLESLAPSRPTTDGSAVTAGVPHRLTAPTHRACDAARVEQPWAVSRRRLLGLGAAAAGALLTGCTGQLGNDTATPTGASASAEPRDPTLLAALTRETLLLDQAAGLGLAGATAVLTVHVASLERAVDSSGLSVGPSSSASTAIPDDAGSSAARSRLVGGLASAADLTQRDVPTATSGEAAALLAAVAASDAALAASLGSTPRTGGASATAWRDAYAVPTPDARQVEASPGAGAAPSVETWQAALDLENAAVFAFGLVGGRLGPDDQRARWSLDTHRARRDALTAALVAASATPTPAAPAYEPDRAVSTGEAARRLAASVERACLASNAALVTAADPAWRAIASDWQRASTLAILGWTGDVEALPGLDPQ